MLDLIITLGGLWPRLLLAPLGPTVIAAAWLLWRAGGRRPGGLGLQPTAPTISALAALLWLPLPATADVPVGLDLLAAWLLLIWPGLSGPEAEDGALIAGQQTLLLTLYAALNGTLAVLPFAAGTPTAAAAGGCLAAAWCVLIGRQIPADAVGGPYRLVGLAVIGWLLAGGALPWWIAGVTAIAAVLIGMWAGRRVSWTVAALLTLSAAGAVLSARLLGVS